MAIRPKPLLEHLRSHGDVFNYDELIGVLIITTASNAAEPIKKALRTQFFDIFGFKDMDKFTTTDPNQCDALFSKVRQRIASKPQRKVCFVYFITAAGLTQNEAGQFGILANNRFQNLESDIRHLAYEFPHNSCHHAVFDFDGKQLANPAPADNPVHPNSKNVMILPLQISL